MSESINSAKCSESFR